MYHYAENNPVKYTNGETWIEKTSNIGLEYLPYRFTGKKIDEETGLYYYGARYLDTRYSRWISTDPPLGEYIPSAGKATASEAGSLPGMGGVFNTVNLQLYHYAGNNPIKYTDPDGKITQHKDLNGKERTKAELKDIINGSFRCGLFASAHASLWEVMNFQAEVDLGSVEISGSLNKNNITTESAGISMGMSVLDTIDNM